nr:MAG TPA: hypothetical protein [Caudoviricetes sp.]
MICSGVRTVHLCRLRVSGGRFFYFVKEVASVEQRSC